jgi:hypothetical protein
MNLIASRLGKLFGDIDVIINYVPTKSTPATYILHPAKVSYASYFIDYGWVKLLLMILEIHISAFSTHDISQLSIIFFQSAP